MWQEYKNQGLQVVGISNEPLQTIENFIADQGITFPVLRDVAGVYSAYNIPGGQSPFPRDFIIDQNGILRMTKTEYDPGTMINIIEQLLSPEVTTDEETLSKKFQLHPNYPNPFNSATTLQFQLETASFIRLDIVDLLGSVVATLAENEYLKDGSFNFRWDALNQNGEALPSGVYIARLRSGENIQIQKMILLK